MKGVIRLGDKTTHGGQVLSASANMKFEGIAVARVGDTVSCPIPGHGLTTIVEGHEHFKDNGIPVAFNEHKCGCGCALISSLTNAAAN